MNFFRMIKMDFKRMFLSGKFYFAIAGAILVTVLNISQEAMQSRWNVSVYYLVVSSHGVGAFFVSVFCAGCAAVCAELLGRQQKWLS